MEHIILQSDLGQIANMEDRVKVSFYIFFIIYLKLPYFIFTNVLFCKNANKLQWLNLSKISPVYNLYHKL